MLLFDVLPDNPGGLGWIFDQQVNVIPLAVHCHQARLEICTYVTEDFVQSLDGISPEDGPAILGKEHQCTCI